MEEDMPAEEVVEDVVSGSVEEEVKISEEVETPEEAEDEE